MSGAAGLFFFRGDAGGLANARVRRIGSHVAISVENCAGLNDENRSLNVATKPASGVNFSAALDFDIAEDLTVNFDLANLDIGVNDGVFADDQLIAAGNRTVEITVDSQRVGKL
jgi:hypothetical protein